MDLSASLPVLLGLAWLVPLASFTLIVFCGPRMGKHGVGAAYVATGAILLSCVLSFIALLGWLSGHPLGGHHDAEHAAAHTGGQATSATHEAETHDAEHAAGDHSAAAHEVDASLPPHYSGDWYSLAEFGSLRITIGYYIDALTIAMFAMVTLIATLIHFYAYGYMHDELHDVTDHEVTLSNGQHLHRPGRFHRFFQYLSLFCFSMLGLVIAGNIAMVFVFWELVGICSYFLIGFYIERKSASTAANKAFIVNRIGDFGMIVGLMALWGALGTFSFGDSVDDRGAAHPGIFSQVRPGPDHALIVPDGMVRFAAQDEIARINLAAADSSTSLEESLPANAVAKQLPRWRQEGLGYGLLVIAGLGIFCGCVGKSAQFPLHTWLPDAMEGPTPVSALVHSATMVAAGVYLVGRFYPVFAPEVLLTIAYIGAITLFIAATIALVAVDIKRVLAYSTVSQLGYMMVALGVGGWLAGVFHLITHAFFKSLLFMCSGSVIHATHTNDMRKMGGLRHKMPWTAYTMLVGCLAIAGAGLPFSLAGFHIGLSGYFSKDAIVAQALFFQQTNSLHSILTLAVIVGAGMTAFYMFRLWFLTFAGPPRDHHIYDHAHESPKVMYVPLVILAVFAVVVAWPIPFTEIRLTNLLEQARYPGQPGQGVLLSGLAIPHEPHLHLAENEAIHSRATLVASLMAFGGFGLAALFYGLRKINAEEVRRQFSGIYNFLWNKWYFDELYQALFVAPVMFISRRIADFDRKVIDRFIDSLAYAARAVASVDDAIDRLFVDAFVNMAARWTYSAGLSLRRVQTGQLRQYVMFIVVGAVGLFVLISFFWSYAVAGTR